MNALLSAPPRRWRRHQRALLWLALLLLLVVAQTLLVTLTLNYESTRVQEETEGVALEVAAEVRRELVITQQRLQSLGADTVDPERFLRSAVEELRARRVLAGLELRDPALQLTLQVDSPFGPPLFSQLSRPLIEAETELACAAARRALTPAFSRSYFVPTAQGQGVEVLDVCVPLTEAGEPTGYLVGTLGLTMLLEEALTPVQGRRFEVSFIEGDGTRLARAGVPGGPACTGSSGSSTCQVCRCNCASTVRPARRA